MIDVGPFKNKLEEAVAACVKEPPFPLSWYDDDPEDEIKREALEMIAEGCINPSYVAKCALNWRDALAAEVNANLKGIYP